MSHDFLLFALEIGKITVKCPGIIDFDVSSNRKIRKRFAG